MELKKLTEENLTRQPEEVFDILCKLGKGSYGSVYKAIHKDSQQILAIKQVPVDNDLQEIIKGLLISEWLFDVLNFPKKNNAKIYLIFALESKKSLNQKDKGTLLHWTAPNY